MNKKISLSILIVLSFVNNLIAQTNYTLLESNPCLYSLLKFKKNYAKDLKETKQNFEITEECSKIACNDSILIELLLADTLNLFSTARIKKSIKESINAKSNSTIALAIALNNCAISLYDSDPDSTINLLKKSSFYFLKEGRYKDVAICFQNIAFTYEEKQKKYSEAIEYSFKSIYYWNNLKDSIGAGNIYKYLGFLYGKICDLDKGINYINKAIKYFAAKQFDRGISVCNYDLGLIYFENNKTDSAIYYLQLSKKQWKTFNDNKRIFGINNKLVNFYFAKKDFTYASQLLEENQVSLNKNNDFYWREKLDFYENAKLFYAVKKNSKEKLHYNNLYTELLDSLKQQKIKL